MIEQVRFTFAEVLVKFSTCSGGLKVKYISHPLTDDVLHDRDLY